MSTAASSAPSSSPRPTMASNQWREKILPLILVQAILFLLFRPLLWNDIDNLRQSGAGSAAFETLWKFGADLLCWILAALAACMVIFDRMGPIAINTFKEAVRNRILYFILLFALVLMGSSGVVKELAIGAHDRIIRNIGLAAINFFGLMVAVFVGISLVYTELDKKSIYTIVSKPLHRYQYLLGKYFGLLLTIYIIVAVMTLFFFMLVNYQGLTTDKALEELLWSQSSSGDYVLVDHAGWVKTAFLLKSAGLALGQAFSNLFGFSYGAVSQNLMILVAMTCLELMIVTAFVVFYSSFTTPTLAAIFSVLTFLAGRLNEDILRFGMQMAKNSLKRLGVDTFQALPFFEQLKIYLVQAVAVVVPNLDSLNLSAEAMSDKTIEVWRFSVLYAICYSATILMFAILIFRKRNFK